MKERIVGSITIIILLSIALILILQRQGLERIKEYNQHKHSIVVESADDANGATFEWVIQIESLEDYQEAQELTKELKNQRFNAFVSKKDIAGKEIYRVRIRPKDPDESIEKIKRSLDRNNFSYQIVPPGQQ